MRYYRNETILNHSYKYALYFSFANKFIFSAEYVRRFRDFKPAKKTAKKGVVIEIEDEYGNITFSKATNFAINHPPPPQSSSCGESSAITTPETSPEVDNEVDYDLKLKELDDEVACMPDLPENKLTFDFSKHFTFN